MKLNYFYIAILLICSESAAQQFSVSGTVTDTAGSPVPGVNIIVEGTGTGTAADTGGRYKIENLFSGKYTLKFTAVGYSTVTIDFDLEDKSRVIDVTLRQKPVESAQVIVTAGKRAQYLSDLPVSADVIHSDEFAKKNISDLENALRYVPGVNMTEDQISIRGSSGYSRGAGSRVLLALDGIPFYTGDTGETIWEMIPTAAIQRVEIIKGAASSLYGSTAIGGVINVITRDIPENPATFIKTFAGVYDKPSYTEWRWSPENRFFNGFTLAHSQRFGKMGLELSLTRLEDMSYKQNGFSHKYIGFLKSNINITQSSSITLLANTLNKKGGNFYYWKDSRHYTHANR